MRLTICPIGCLSTKIFGMLHNKLGREELERRLGEEPFSRTTISFYRYVCIEDPSGFRDDTYRSFEMLGCLGRVYVAHEGINAQLSVPSVHLDAFLNLLDSVAPLAHMPIKYAVDEGAHSFLKLIVKVRHKIVADGLDDKAFDTTNVGTHLSALEFHNLVGCDDVVVVDMRNSYESEVGHFEGAITPDAVTFREELQLVTDILDGKRDKKILLYCTGGVRCEKASAYLKHHGFEDVNQLHGGIIEYARQVRQLNLTSKFIGKNFVFDNRMGERITNQVLSTCHQCGASCDTHVNCANNQCHLLFIQCASCAEANRGCCSIECKGALDDPTLAKGIVFKGKRWRRYSGEITMME